MSYYHQILGIPLNAGKETIKRAYRRKAKMYHPDRNPSPEAREKFILAHEAYQYLIKNPETAYRRPHGQKMSKADIMRAEAKERAREKARAAHYAKMRYEQYKKENEAFRNSKYAWLYKCMYLIGYIFFLIFACLIGSIPIFAGFNEGWYTIIFLGPIFCFGFYGMVLKATKWKREMDKAFTDQ